MCHVWLSNILLRSWQDHGAKGLQLKVLALVQLVKVQYYVFGHSLLCVVAFGAADRVRHNSARNGSFPKLSIFRKFVFVFVSGFTAFSFSYSNIKVENNLEVFRPLPTVFIPSSTSHAAAVQAICVLVEAWSSLFPPLAVGSACRVSTLLAITSSGCRAEAPLAAHSRAAASHTTVPSCHLLAAMDLRGAYSPSGLVWEMEDSSGWKRIEEDFEKF
jgi:hypothetical protein